MQYNIGDSVRFMDFDGDGKVTAVLEHGFLEIEVEGMRMRVSEREVVRVEADEGKDERLLYDGNTQVSRFKQHPADVRHSASVRKRSSREAEVMVVDLHLDKIRLKYPAARNIPDEDALYVQLDVFGKSMAEALANTCSWNSPESHRLKSRAMPLPCSASRLTNSSIRGREYGGLSHTRPFHSRDNPSMCLSYMTVAVRHRGYSGAHGSKSKGPRIYDFPRSVPLISGVICLFK